MNRSDKKNTKTTKNSNASKKIVNIKTRQNTRTNSSYTTSSKYQNNVKRNTSIKNSSSRNSQYKSTRSTSTQSKKVRKIQSKRNFDKISSIFTTIIFIIIIGYFGISIFKIIENKPIEYEMIEYGTIDNYTQVKGIIIREEKVYTVSKSGVLSFNVSEYDKVKKGDLIASVKNSEAIKSTEQDLDEINQAILQIQQKRDELSLFSEDVKKMNTQIKNTIDSVIYEINASNMDKIYEIKDSISKKINIRNQMLLSESTGSVQELVQEKAIKESIINENIENLYSDVSGIVSFSIDGLEEVLNFETKDTLIKEQTTMKSDGVQDFKINIVEGEPAFKIVTSNDFYIASYIKTESISSWKEGQYKTIYINDDGDLVPLEVYIEKMDFGEKESYVLLRSNKGMINYINKRNVTFEVAKPTEGFKIEQSAKVVKELLQVPTSYILDDKVIKKAEQGNIEVSIQVSGQNETGDITYVSLNYSVLGIGDTIISPINSEEYTIQDVFRTEGIYIVNSGIYSFRRINTDGAIENEEYIILDPDKNTNIKIYDRYVPNYKIVEEEITE